MLKNKYYSLDENLKYNVDYIFIYCERSSGKTYYKNNRSVIDIEKSFEIEKNE